MSESYTEGGDTLQEITFRKKAGQTFIPLETHVLEYIDVNVKGVNSWLKPTIRIYWADAENNPWGDCLSAGSLILEKEPTIFNPGRVRIKMGHYVLQKQTRYAMIMSGSDSLVLGNIHWLYDKGDATYIRGVRLLQEDFGEPWQKFPNDDHIFVEFGLPPTPEPPPDPPIINWALLDIKQYPRPTGFRIVTTTNVPCHMYFVYTTTEPEKHKDPRYRRGTIIANLLRLCFVNWKQNEQEEPGDTLYHTFIKDDWPVCETRWFLFRAKVDGDWSPSVSPMFKKHRSEIVRKFYCDYDPETSSVDGMVGRAVRNITWGSLRDGPGTIAAPSHANMYLRLHSDREDERWWHLYNCIMTFDTSEILPYFKIIKAVLGIYGSSKYKSSEFELKPAIYRSDPLSDTDLVPADYNRLFSMLLSDVKTFDEIDPDGWNIWTLNASGLAAIKKGSITRLALRDSNYDAPDIPPDWENYKLCSLIFQTADFGLHAHGPYLEVTYKET